MAQPRVYRDDMQCPRCGSNWLPKHGHARGKQTYRCRQCLYHFTPEAKHPHQPEKVRNMAAAMYAEGSSMAAISRVMGVKAETVYSWVKKSRLGQGTAANAGPPTGPALAGASSTPRNLLA